MDHFLHRHPGGGTTTSNFHFRGRPQGSQSYGYDNKRCFTAHNTLGLSICSTSLIILSWPVWLTCLVCCLWMADSDCLSVYLIVSQFVFQLVHMLFCVLSVCLSEAEEELFTCVCHQQPVLVKDVQFPGRCDRSHRFLLPLPTSVFPLWWKYGMPPFVPQDCLYIQAVIKWLFWQIIGCSLCGTEL